MACAAGAISPARLTASGLGPGAPGAVIFQTFVLSIVLSVFGRSVFTLSIADQSQLSAPPVWYSITRVSKKFRSFFRSIISAIHGKGFSSCG